jgi:hypothetical protein
MLVWATEFPIRDGNSAEDVLCLAKKWLIGSPHSSWTRKSFDDESYGVINLFVDDGQSVETVNIINEQDAWVGFRHSWIEDGERCWITEIVAYQKSSRVLVSIQVHCELLRPGLKMPPSRKPYVVKLLLEDIGGGIDGVLPVSDKAIYMQESEVEKAAQLILGKTHNHLPIIYVSAKWNGQPAIDADRLAMWASGMAHVIVEPSRYFSYALARITDRQNAYGGAVSVCWPGQGGSQVRLFLEDYYSPTRLSTGIADLVRRALAASRLTPECTWDHLQEKVSSARIEALRASGSREIDEYIYAFDKEIAAKDARIKKSEVEIARLRLELQNATNTANSSRAGIVRAGKEQQFYADEVRDVIIKALEKSKAQFYTGGRCVDIIEDILSVNSLSGQQDEMEEEIKKALNSSMNLGRKERKALEYIGFTFSDDGRHIEAIYQGDPRYVFTIQKSGSDWRGMKNLASEICKKLFR